MKNSIRTRFTMGMIFLFVIILVLSVFSGYYLNKMSNKTEAILKENYLSIVYAREMTDGILNITQELSTSFLTRKYPDSTRIAKHLASINNSLELEKNNITEPGEDRLVSGIETGFIQYRDSVLTMTKSPDEAGMLYLQKEAGILSQQLLILSDMNGKALQTKTDDAKTSSKNALTRMTVLATICFLVGMSFTFSFSSYFNRRFFALYNGIKEIVSGNFDQRLYLDGNDEFYEISLVFNEMADKLMKNKQKMSLTLHEESGKGISSSDKEELDKMLFRLKTLEEQAAALISRFEKK
jgi:two-component system, NtrC family, sensor histidine kinase KinB